ncbi:MAG: tetratricopeptide repeat protein [Chthoniobacterales bacterium]
MQSGNFFAELKRRNVYKVAVAYAVVGWLLVQVATQVFPFFDIPNWTVRLVVLVLVIGFPIALGIAWTFDLTPQGLKRTDEIARPAPPNERSGRLAPRESFAPEKSIAVLPFENLSEEKANAYFATGMGDEILTKLAELAELKVISRASTERYQSHPYDLRAVGRELGVATVLVGSVQKAKDEVLIRVQLIDARSDTQLWAQSYQRCLQNIFDLEAEVAEKVAEALKVKLVPAEAERLAAPATTNPHAHDLYLRARALVEHSDEQSLVQTIALLRQALIEDPHFAMAWAHLAWAYLLIMDAYRAPLEFLAPAQHAALMAVANDDRAAAGHIFLGAIALLFNWDFPVAKRELERAVALDPHSSDARGWHAWYLARVEKDFVAARAELEQAQTLDPFYTWQVWGTITVAIAQGDYEAAMKSAERILTIDPNFLYDEDPIAHVYLAMGRWQEGVERYESLPASTLGGPSFELAVCYAHTGETERAKQILHELETRAQHRYVDRTHIAAIYAALGEKDKAFAELERAVKDRSARISAPRFYPWLAPLWDDPRLAALEEKIRQSALPFPADPAAEFVTTERRRGAEKMEPNESMTRQAWLKRAVALVLLALLALGLLIFQKLGQKSTQTLAPANPVASEKSIAVLPFENLSADQTNGYFVSGIQNEILTKLAQLGQLKVISTRSTEKYQSHPQDLRVVGQQLDVGTVLEGTVQKAGDEMLINVQLIDVQTGNHLWAQSYKRQLQNLFDMEAEVAEKVAEALQLKLLPAEARQLLVAATTNPRAHDLYLRAHVLTAHSDEQSIEQAIALLRQAVAEDPHYAIAWAELAGAHIAIADAYRAPLEILAPARHAARMAVANDDKVGAGHTYLGAIELLYDWNFPVAKRELERGIELNPNSSDAHRWYGSYLARVEKDFLAARVELEKSRSLDPLYPWPLWTLSNIAIAQGDYESALRFAERILEIDPHFFYDEDPIAHAYAAMGRWPEALKRYESLQTSAFVRPNFELAICCAHVGQAARARSILAELEALAQRRYIDQTHVAAIYAALGDKDQAFAALERACADRSARISAPRFYSWLSPLMNDPRFAALEDKIAHSAISLPADLGSNR